MVCRVRQKRGVGSHRRMVESCNVVRGQLLNQWKAISGEGKVMEPPSLGQEQTGPGVGRVEGKVSI